MSKALSFSIFSVFLCSSVCFYSAGSTVGKGSVTVSKKQKLSQKSPEKKDPRSIRDSLFKCKYLTQEHQRDYLNHTKTLRNINFRQANCHTIPPIALSSMARGRSSSKADREMFIKSIIAAIKCVNQVIMEQRALVVLVKKKGLGNLSEEQKEKFQMICSFYQTSKLDELLKRVAPLPVSMAAAQASIESGFGSCKFMHDAKAYFGIMKNRTQLYSFDSVFESVIAYAKTLNVNRSYRNFREERAKMLNASQKIDGTKLCEFIGRYCVKKEYSQRLKVLMKEYKLWGFDQTFDISGEA